MKGSSRECARCKFHPKKRSGEAARDCEGDGELGVRVPSLRGVGCGAG